MAEAEGFHGMPVHQDLSEDEEYLSTDALPMSPESSEVTDSKSTEAYEDSDDNGLDNDDLEYEQLDQRLGHFAKDNFQPVWENKKITLAAERVCYINTPEGTNGTGFRAGSKYIFTAAHVVRNWSSDIGDEYKKQEYYALFEYLREQQFKYAPKFYFQAVVYENTDLDTTVIELDETKGSSLPRMFTRFDDFGKFIKNAKDNHTDNTFFFVGHPGGLPMQHDVVDQHFPLRKHNIKQFKSLDAKSIKEYKRSYDIDKQPRNLFDARRVLFNCNFRHGGSGSPGVYYGESDTPVVVTFLQQGYPWWYYGKKDAGHKWKEVDCVQQGINFNAVYKDMKEKNRDLFNDIFSQSVANFEQE